jgi:hypothetical protein
MTAVVTSGILLLFTEEHLNESSSGPIDQPQAVVTAALKKLDEGMPHEALAILCQLAGAPPVRDAKAVAGLAYAKLGDVDDAIHALKTELRHFPDNATATQFLGQLLQSSAGTDANGTEDREQGTPGSEAVQEVAETSKHLEDLLRLSCKMDTLPELGGLESVSVNGRRFWAKPYNINWKFDFRSTVSVPEEWNPCRGGERLGEQLPYDWLDEYRHVFKQEFNPNMFYFNCLALVQWKPKSHAEEQELLRLKDELVDRMLEYTEMQGRARFVVQRFDYPTFKLVKGPWVSGIIQGSVLIGLTYLHDCFHDEELIPIADEIALAYRHHWKGDDGPFWFTAIDDEGFLWFEEFPLESDAQPKVVNGHIHALEGLYCYHRLRPCEDVKKLMLGGITFVHRHINEYRIPGKINAYDLLEFREDYLPSRTVNQMMQLSCITGDPYFLKMAAAFKEDFHVAESIKIA